MASKFLTCVNSGIITWNRKQGKNTWPWSKVMNSVLDASGSRYLKTSQWRHF